MSESPCDDVIAIRVDTARAVRDFLDQLRRQADEGETEAPAKPANRAVFRELAPYRLVEYDYVEPGIGAVDGAYLGFPDGGVYNCGEVIPEEAVDALVADPEAALPPLYVYVLLAAPAPEAAITHYLDALALHLGMPLVGVFHRGDGAIATGIHAGDCEPDSEHAAALQAGAAAVAAEAGRLLTRAQVVERHAASSHLPDGRAYAHLSHRFSRRILEFPSMAERDGFVAWTRRFCAMAAVEGAADVLRPAEPCAVPPPDFRVIQVRPPTAADDQPAAARAYWTEVTAVIDRVMAAEQEAAKSRR
jgi:hypothetical protein